MKLKLNKNVVLIGLLLGVIFFCALRDCTFLEGFKEGVNEEKDENEEGDTEDEEEEEKEDEEGGFLGNLESAVKGAAKGAGTLVKKANETNNVFKSASEGETLDELESKK